MSFNTVAFQYSRASIDPTRGEQLSYTWALVSPTFLLTFVTSERMLLATYCFLPSDSFPGTMRFETLG